MELEYLEDMPTIQTRFSEACWAKNAENYPIVIGGAGGIGSWTSLFLGSIGYDLHLYDFDNIEIHNLGGQFYSTKDISKSKVEALRDHLNHFREAKINIYNQKYTLERGLISPIMISCFDNMKARKEMFENWKTQKDKIAFIDGRMQAEMGMYYCVLPGQEELYEKELFDDTEVPELNCNYKATTHCGAFIGSQLTALVTNVIYNSVHKASIRETPFKTNFNFPMMSITSEI
jgi:molybdopterin/thiamine biosynthesis adenylyltransferase